MSTVPTGIESVETEEAPFDEESVARGSLKERIARRREELAQQHPIELDIPGYEDVLAVRYHALDFRVQFKIEKRHEKVKDEAEMALRVAADLLLEACDELLEKRNGKLHGTGYRWGTRAARDLFGVDVPDGMTERIALGQCFSDEGALIEHCAQYSIQTRRVRPEIDEELAGE